ncbi:hypothetical protein D3C71_1895820 [compost metagenome]
MSDMPRPFVLWRQALAQVVQQARPAHGQRLLVQGCLLQNAQGVRASIDFRVVDRGLRNTKQRVDLRHQHLECAACAQNLNKHLWLIFHQGAGNFLPAALRGQRLKLA